MYTARRGTFLCFPVGLSIELILEGRLAVFVVKRLVVFV